MDVRCPCCHRHEIWTRNPRGYLHVEVRVQGGARRPEGDRNLVAWRVIRRALSGETGPVVGRCRACSQPLIAVVPCDEPVRDWRIETPRGALSVDAEGIRGPDGVLALAEADRFVESQFREPRLHDPGRTAFGLAALAIFGFPIVLWVAGAVFALNFIYQFLASGASGSPW